jgi:signal transduction histidine kinase
LSDELESLRDLEDKIRRLTQEQGASPRDAEFQSLLNAHLAALVQYRALETERVNALLRENLAEIKRHKERLVTTVHDLKTPLTLCLLNLELARQETVPGERDAYLHGLRRELEFMVDTVATMLDLERDPAAPAAAAPPPIPLRALVDGVLARMAVLIQDRPGLALRNEIPADLPPVPCDALALSRVFTNLFSNAIKYTQRGTITAGGGIGTPGGGPAPGGPPPAEPPGQAPAPGGPPPAEPPGQAPALPMPPPALRLFVRDTGAGMDPAHAAGLFRMFQGDAARADSSGVGLLYVRQALARHGGRVWLESERGVGTCVFVELPLGAPTAPDAAPRR